MTEMIFRALRAREGDALLILADGATVLIDGGTSGVYKSALREELEMLPMDGDEPPKIDLMMVSHMDGDHIGGILELTDELLEARDEESDPIVRIERAWHNSFSDMLAKQGAETASTSGAQAASLASAFEGFDPALRNELHQSELVLAGVNQGRRLRRDLNTLNIPQNKRFKDRLVMRGGADKPWKRGNLTIEVVGPGQEELDDLADKWKKELPKITDDDPFVVASASKALDKSVSNLASIVAVARTQSKSILLTGDARGDMILPWLEQTEHLQPGGKVHFDVVKMPHHGAMGNVSKEFYDRVTGDHYIFSGNGRHGNPEPGALELLFLTRPALDYLVHITYDLDEIKSRKEFIKAGNVEELDRVLAEPGRMDILRFPDSDALGIEIAL